MKRERKEKKEREVREKEEARGNKERKKERKRDQPACPVPLTRQVAFDAVWNSHDRPCLISSMMARKGGCMWPRRGSAVGG